MPSKCKCYFLFYFLLCFILQELCKLKFFFVLMKKINLKTYDIHIIV